MNTYTIIIPVYKHTALIPKLIKRCQKLNRTLKPRPVFVFVDDACPEKSAKKLKKELAKTRLKALVIRHIKNTGSFIAIKTGLKSVESHYYATLSNDLQEPHHLIVDSFTTLSTSTNHIVIGARSSRQDPSIMSHVFWRLYQQLIPAVPTRGADMFAITKKARDTILSLSETNTSLVGQLLWTGYQHTTIAYNRDASSDKKSGWTIWTKAKYAIDSIFSFTDKPIHLLIILGIVQIITSLMVTLIVLCAKIIGAITVPGYTATVIITSFFGGINSFGLGIIGLYVWRIYENTKARPEAIVDYIETINPKA